MYLIKLQYSVLGILNIYICLTHLPLENVSKRLLKPVKLPSGYCVAINSQNYPECCL